MTALGIPGPAFGFIFQISFAGLVSTMCGALTVRRESCCHCHCFRRLSLLSKSFLRDKREGVQFKLKYRPSARR